MKMYTISSISGWRGRFDHKCFLNPLFPFTVFYINPSKFFLLKCCQKTPFGILWFLSATIGPMTPQWPFAYLQSNLSNLWLLTCFKACGGFILLGKYVLGFDKALLKPRNQVFLHKNQSTPLPYL